MVWLLSDVQIRAEDGQPDAGIARFAKVLGEHLRVTLDLAAQQAAFAGTRRIESWHLPVVAGIWPLLSWRNAQFMNNEVPGVSVPEDVMERMRVASELSKEHGLREGVSIARETLARVRGQVAGVQVSAPLGRVDLALQVFEGLVEARVTA